MTDLPPSNPSLISDLFAKDPLKLTREDRREMIEYYRRNRALWVSGGRVKTTKEKKPVPAGGLSLDDLEL